MSRKDEWTDEDILMALHLRDHERLTLRQIAERFGRTRNAIVGVLNRVDNDTRATDNGHQNGTMAPLWWRRNRAAAA